MPCLLVIDDDRTVLRLVTKAFEQTTMDVVTATSAREGLELLRTREPEVVLLDVMLPETTGIELVEEIRKIDSRLPLIFITALDDSQVAIEAMKLGAYDYLLKPLDLQHLQDLVERALETRRLMVAPVSLQPTEERPALGDSLVGKSPPMLEVYKQIGRVAAQDVTVMIRGESGTGKELIARAIHQHSHLRENLFMAVNCAALSDTLLESELFGHEKGAFTGADRRHIGKFEQCNNGTIFLDEIGDMSPSTQSKVLRLLQEQRFERVGGSETIQVHVRVISATHRPLEKMIEEGTFRLDLFHRLNAFEIVIPPLNERGDDLDLLIKHFLRILNGQLGKQIAGFSPEALGYIQRYSWPGNIRELQSVIRKAMLMATGPVIVPEFLPKEILAAPRAIMPLPSVSPEESCHLEALIDQRLAASSKNLHAEAVEVMERYLIARVLRETNGNQSKAAEILGITRGSLRNKIRSLKIWINQVISTSAEGGGLEAGDGELLPDSDLAEADLTS